MKLLGLTVLLSSAVVFAGDAEARGGHNSFGYKVYGYNNSTTSSNYRNKGVSNSNSRYKMYGYSRGNSSFNTNRSSRSRHGRSYYGNTTSHQAYNDPTGYRFVKISSQRLAMPTGSYGRAANRVRVGY